MSIIKTDKLIIVDGNSLINRAFYALPPLNAANGNPSNAVYGFTTMLLKLINDYGAKYLAVAFDMRAPTFRHKMYDGYKATRKGMPDELAVQMPMLKDLLRAMNISILEQEGIEADDILGTLSKKFDMPTVIVTGDRDALQLVSSTCTVLLTKRGISETVSVTPESITQLYGLTPPQIIEYKALAGDASDNIPGVGGVGEKTATDLLSKYDTLDGVYAHISEIKGKLAEKLANDKEKAYLSRELATIKTDCDVDVQLADMEYDYPFSAKVLDLFYSYGFKSLIKKSEYFADDIKIDVPSEIEIEIKQIKTTDQLLAAAGGAQSFALAFSADSISLSPDGKTEYLLSTEQTLLDIAPTREDVITALKPILANSSITKIVYDAKAVMKVLDSVGATISGFEDIALMQYLADMRIKTTNAHMYAADCGHKKDTAAANLFRRFAVLSGELRDLQMDKLYTDVEKPLIGVLRDMERVGFKLDMEMLARLGKSFSAEETQLVADITALAGQTFNVNSPKQLAKVLFEDMKIPYPKKGGNYSTSAEILTQISGYEIIDKILRYRFLSKIRSTYIEGLRNIASSDGVVHTEFNQMLTTTGRLSSSEPNLQNIPVREDESRELRGAFIAHDGNILVAADYSQIELRVMAHLSGDKNLTDAFIRGEDIHSSVAMQLFDVTKANLTSKMRRIAKTVNFGIIYGMSAFGLASRLGISNYEAKSYIDKYFVKYSGVRDYMDSIVKTAKEKGYTESILGRRRVIPELKSSDYKQRQFGERAALNMPIQASAADIIKLAMLKVAGKLQGSQSKLILQVHDELIIETSEADAARIAAMLKTEMESAMTLSVPLVADAKVGKSWLECK